MVYTQNIVKAISWVITLPIYVYALIKWRQFHSHFLIRNRFPTLSYTLFYIMFIAQTVSVIESSLFDFKISPQSLNNHITYFILSLTFTISGLILYRVNLICQKWKASLSISVSNIPRPVPLSSNKSNTPNTTNKSNPQPFDADIKAIRNPYRSTLSLITLCFIFIGSVFLYASYMLSVYQFHTYSLIIIMFTILTVFIAVSIWNIKRKKVEEGIGCIKECYAILISLIVQIALQLLLPNEDNVYILECSMFYVLNYQAMVTLYIPLYLLFKAEGTLNISVYNDGLHGHIFRKNRVTDSAEKVRNSASAQGNTKVVSDNSDFLEEPDTDKQKRESNTSKGLHLVSHRSNSFDVIIITQSLFEFLYRNELNHSIFSNYLRFCFAIENLLFVERVSIFYQIVLRMKENNDLAKAASTYTSDGSVFVGSGGSIGSETLEISENVSKLDLANELVTPVTPSIPNSISIDMQSIHRLEFVYLKDIYQHYERVIDDDEQYDITQCKKALFDICQEIYDQFISCFAETQINLSHNVQASLERMLCGTRGEGVDKFESYHDFLVLFDGALIEAYRLMISAYLFQFKKYVKQRFDNVQFV